ncbi:MAG: hypothetical protein AABW79_02210 [Nanoarchaeota archaeon]
MEKTTFLRYFLWLLLITAIFTTIDTIVHYNVEALEVYSYPIPSTFLFISSSPLFWYAVGKFVGTLIIGSLLFFFVRKGKSPFVRALILALPVIILLEVRYLISGNYDADWHTYNTIMHFVVLLVTSWIVFAKTRLFEK